MLKRLFLFVSLGISLLLTGCITIDIQTIINADGSGERVMITAIDTDAYKMLMLVTPEPGEEIEDPLQSIWDECAEDPRVTCEEYVDAEKEVTGVRVSIPFSSLDELVALSDDPTLGGSDEITFEQSGDTTTMRITVNTQEVGSEVAKSSGEMEATPLPEATLTAEEEEMQRQILEMMDINLFYRVTAPASISAYEPQENATYDEAENTVTWEMDLLSEEPVQELSLTWGGPPIEAGEEPAAQVTPEPTEEPTATVPATPEATEEPLPEPTSPPVVSPPTEGKKSLCQLCPCLPGIALPVLALGSVLVTHRRRSV